MNINIILNALIHILILVLLFSFFINNKNDTNSIIFILAVTTVFICYLLEFVRKPSVNCCVDKECCKDKECCVDNNLVNRNNNLGNTIENFSSPIEYKVSDYDGIDVRKVAKEKKKTNLRNTVKLLSNVGAVTPTGLEGNYVEDPLYQAHSPLIDGTKDGKRALFMLTYNQSSPDCCPSTYSSSTGCVCTTQNQRDFVKTRGHNRSKFTYPGI
uniref:Uncharacterized protein n=1 Tax=Mimiviridae sp. ChoanoV1 TaxID=2596887 RepID=A0A5B8IDT9_9VIRU|nr:hypothetical protein 2_58 [Mimiviridae sp. ChoanoV1]